MKRILILLIIGVLLVSSPVAVSEEMTISDSVRDQLNQLDLNEFDRFIESLEIELTGGRGISDYLLDVINGESIDLISVFREVFENSIKILSKCATMAVSIIIISILYSTLHSLKGNFGKVGVSGTVNYVCVVAVLTISLGIAYPIVDSVISTVKIFGHLMDIVFPIMITMLTVVGAGQSALTFSPMMGILNGVLLNGVSNVILPIFLSCTVLSILGHLTDSVKFDNMRKFLKSSAEWLLSISFGLYFVVASANGIISSGIDGVSIRAAKFALGSYVPIVGGYLSDGFDMVMAGSVLIKNAVGFSSIVLIGILVLEPLLKISFFVLTLRLTSGVIESYADVKVTGVIGSISSNFSVLIATLLGVGFLFFLTVIMCVFCANMGGL